MVNYCIRYEYIESKIITRRKYSGIVRHNRHLVNDTDTDTRVGVKYSTCTWYLYLSTHLSVLDVLEYLVYENVKVLVLVLVLVLDQKVLGT